MFSKYVLNKESDIQVSKWSKMLRRCCCPLLMIPTREKGELLGLHHMVFRLPKISLCISSALCKWEKDSNVTMVGKRACTDP